LRLPLKFNELKQKPLALISPLDWGLGHTTRCIPLIRHLRNNGYEVVVACNSRQKRILLNEFDGLHFEELPGYEVRYGRSALSTILLLLFQVPKILIRIKHENKWVRAFEQTHKPDMIISDNRFGFYSRSVRSVFITHQLSIHTGLGGLVDSLARKINYRLIAKFTECWVPDQESLPGMAGKLSHPKKLPGIPLHYIGDLSRMQQIASNSQNKTDLLIILSGPEPQRSIMEALMIQELGSFTGYGVLVRGLAEGASNINSLPNVSMLNYAPAAELNQMMISADLIISRCGYTTVMDILKLGKRSVLIPTPGQAEQEYLARHLKETGMALTVKQRDFKLSTALEAARAFTYRHAHFDQEFLG
jgi:UDP:flavonoid glycosyltransferase YjiC (YdhE family)